MKKNEDWYDVVCDWTLIVVLLLLAIKSCSHLYLVKDQVRNEDGSIQLHSFD